MELTYGETFCDEIRIRGLTLFANHGVHPEEKALGQKFVVNCTLFLSTEEAGMTDDLTASVSYSDAAKQIAASMKKGPFDLIEKAADVIAMDLLHAFPLLREVEVELEKPQAPVKLPLETVSVKIRRGWHRAFVALGSNLGDSAAYLDGAVKGLSGNERIRNVRESSRIVTAPYGVTDQPDFLNSVCELETVLSPIALLHTLQKLEQEAKRERIIHWGPRTLDLDLLFYENRVSDSAELILPHPEIAKRSFVLAPMAELAPGFVHPVAEKTMKELLERLAEQES